MDVKVTADPQREKEILAALDPYITKWIDGLKEALSGVKVEIKITGLYPEKKE
jgi:hypothetical protein